MFNLFRLEYSEIALVSCATDVVARNHEFSEVDGDLKLYAVITKSKYLLIHVEKGSHVVARVIEVASCPRHIIAMNLVFVVIGGDLSLPFEIVGLRQINVRKSGFEDNVGVDVF